MMFGILIGAIAAIVILLVLLYLLGYSLAYHWYILFTISTLVFTFGFGDKTANFVYVINETETYSIEEQYQNDEKTNAFHKSLGGLCFFSLLGLLAMSGANLFVLRESVEVAKWVSIVVFVPALLLFLAFLFVMKLYSHRII